MDWMWKGREKKESVGFWPQKLSGYVTRNWVHLLVGVESKDRTKPKNRKRQGFYLQ